jgi:cation:H+ antiporter
MALNVPARNMSRLPVSGSAEVARGAMLSGLSLPIQALLFLGAAILVCLASTWLSTSSTGIANQLHLGEALAGQLLLAIVEDLPEVVVVVAGSFSGHLALITGNLLGGIAAQTVLLVAVDATGVRDRPLSYRATSLQLILVGLQGVLILGLAVMATQLPAGLHAWRFDPGSSLILIAWIGTTLLLKRAQAGLPWQQDQRAPLPPEVEKARDESETRERQTGLWKIVLIFAASALGVLVGGVVLEQTGSQMADALGIGGLLFGATFLAFATGLPELVTGLTASRQGEFAKAVSGVFGSNTFLPVLFFLATLLSGQAVLGQAGTLEVYLTGLGLVLTTIYLWGLLFRSDRQYLRLGADSIAVLVVYVLGILGLVALAHFGS